MNENELLLLNLLLTIIGGSLGAKTGNAPAWKGATTITAGALIAYFLANLASVDNMLIVLACNLVAILVFGSAIKLSGRQIVSVIAGAVVVGFVGMFAINKIINPTT
ncbi:hypothetical protein [Brucella sp. 10RB9213]|uniref:hypothetical protein n=1 Tax=Brucella sp. 10RB9213 TaxID=1844039 RepID=UPI0012AE4717|nr:hypothetical protein [Brucella sp. 10RB9213]MRN66532.1 hypothetical protein [Brucella sp. 10RB9213]